MRSGHLHDLQLRAELSCFVPPHVPAASSSLMLFDRYHSLNIRTSEPEQVPRMFQTMFLARFSHVPRMFQTMLLHVPRMYSHVPLMVQTMFLTIDADTPLDTESSGLIADGNERAVGIVHVAVLIGPAGGKVSEGIVLCHSQRLAPAHSGVWLIASWLSINVLCHIILEACRHLPSDLL